MLSGHLATDLVSLASRIELMTAVDRNQSHFQIDSSQLYLVVGDDPSQMRSGATQLRRIAEASSFSSARLLISHGGRSEYLQPP